MSFFNNKNQVLKFELTPYGRYLMSQGKLDPYCYEFVDDDILYDDQQVGGSEIQNETFERIKFETPKLIPNPNKSSIKRGPWSYRTTDEFGGLNLKSNQAHQMPLGKNSPETVKTPAFSMLMLDGEITGSKKVYNGNSLETNVGSFENTMIPQFDFQLDFYLRRRNQFRFEKSFDIRNETAPLDDGRIMYVEEDNIMIYLKEFGSEYEKENYDIEVFEITNEESGSFKETLRTLYFDLDERRLVNDMIIESNASRPKLEIRDDLTVAHYFELAVDSEINPDELCEKIRDIKVDNIFLDDDLQCPEYDPLDKFDIYATRVSPEDLEDCD